MELVLADDGAPYEWSEFKGMVKVPKYGDFPRLSLRFHEGDFACYTFRGCAEGDAVRVKLRSRTGGVLRIEASGAASEFAVQTAAWSASEPLSLGEGDVTVRLSCVSGEVDVRAVSACREG